MAHLTCYDIEAVYTDCTKSVIVITDAPMTKHTFRTDLNNQIFHFLLSLLLLLLPSSSEQNPLLFVFSLRAISNNIAFSRHSSPASIIRKVLQQISFLIQSAERKYFFRTLHVERRTARVSKILRASHTNVSFPRSSL